MNGESKTNKFVRHVFIVNDLLALLECKHTTNHDTCTRKLYGYIQYMLTLCSDAPFL